MIIDNLQWKIRWAIQRLHKRYHKYPWIFITEADIKCSLYSELLKSSLKARKTIVMDKNDKKIKDWEYQLFTRPIHAELSSSKGKTTEFVDLKKLSLIEKTKKFPYGTGAGGPKKRLVSK